MGASNWWHFTTYQEDILVAFQQLQNQVFDEVKDEEAWKLLGSLDRMVDPGEKIEPLSAPQTIEELRERCGAMGTATILDMVGIGAQSRSRLIGPCPKELLQKYMGTFFPTRQEIEEAFELNVLLPPTESAEERFLREQKEMEALQEEGLLDENGFLTELALKKQRGESESIPGYVMSVWDDIPTGTGFYIIVYKEKQPDELFFAGWSGD
jgi:hypothetical protein